MTPFALGLALRQRGSFSLRKLFAGGASGIWYDPSDIGSMYQDSAGTIAAAVNQPVGKILDKSGRGNHAIQATSGYRPVLRRDGGGFYYLEFDGVDDKMTAVFGMAQPWDRISAIQSITWTAPKKFFGGGVPSSTLPLGGILQQQGTSPQLRLHDGNDAVINADLAVGVNGVATERHAGASSRLAINNGAYVTGNPGTNAATGISLATVTPTQGNHGNVRIYGVVMIGRTLSDSEIGKVRRFMAAKAGVSL
jgi:hypothetical protein